MRGIGGSKYCGTTYAGTLAALLALANGGCVGHEPRGRPLFATQGKVWRRSEIAVLSGPIVAVDDVMLTERAQAYELLPGCHIVVVGGRAGQADPFGDGWAASLPRLFFPFRMQAGGSYAINLEREAQLGMTSVSRAYVVARASDANGHVAIVPAARTEEDLHACQAWQHGGANAE